MTARPIFVVKLQAAPNVDAVRSLRALLKTLLRKHGFRGLDAREVEGKPHEDDPEM